MNELKDQASNTLPNNDLGMATTKLDSRTDDEKNELLTESGAQNGLMHPNTSSNHSAIHQSTSNTECSTLVQSSYGTIKKTVLYSPVGFLFQWTTTCTAGNAPFYSLLLSISSASIVIIMLLFGGRDYGEWWFIMFLVFFIVVSIASLCFISLFIQDDSIQTFKVS